jgi:ferritin-like metal-binding protein YciE
MTARAGEVADIWLGARVFGANTPRERPRDGRDFESGFFETAEPHYEEGPKPQAGIKKRMMTMSNLRETFIEELKDLYDAEKQITKALPKMAKAAENDELREGFETHLEETEEHIRRLEQVFKAFGETPKGKKCKAMEGLIAEGKDIIDEEEGDAALICAAQKVEHYEIASYGSLIAWAKLLEEDEAVDFLQQTLEEEETTDEKLTEIAESAVNVEESEGEEETASAGSNRRGR